jgi:CheY-like chemotaxis protein
MAQHATILLVEDNDDDILLMQRAFARARLANPLRIVRDGEQAIQYLAGEGKYSNRERYPFPLMLLLDLHLPKTNGFEVLEWIRGQSKSKDLIIVVLTSSADQRDFQEAHALGADSYMLKPGSLEELVKLMLRIQGHWLLLDRKPERFPVTIEP